MKTLPHSSLERSMARTTLRLVVVGLLAIALLPPLLWAGVGTLIERERVEATAVSTAWLLDTQVVAGRVDASIAAGLLVRQPFDPASGQRSIVDALGTPIATVGVAAAWPAMTTTLPLRHATVRVAAVQVRHSLQPLLAATALVALASGALAWALWLGALGRPVRALGQTERRLRSVASRDVLTGLLNREGLRLRMGRALERCRGSSRAVGVLLIDLDRFRLVNDSLGQPAGDQLLRGVADRIRAMTRDRDAVARLGADQFVVQVEGVCGIQALTVMARNLLRAFEPAYALGGDDTTATLSIGIAVAGEHADTVDQLLRCADTAMRAAKAEGGGRFRSYDPAMQGDDAMRLDIDRRLRCALQADEFFLVFQPIVDADGERVVGVEALLRWADPARGVVQPAEFIPMLEQTGLIVPVGRWVLREACRRGAAWMAAGARGLVLSVNVSPRQFAEADYIESVTAVLAETGFPPTRLQLEVTEGLLLDPTPQSLHKIEMLAEAGVRLVVDDFGMGYSSLAYLKRFRLHGLKIDRMFVRDIALHRRDAAIARAIVDLGHGLGLHVTAEGVESVEQVDELRRIGCDAMQGFLFARPVGADEIQAMLATRAVGAGDDDPVPGWSTTMAALLPSTRAF